VTRDVRELAGAWRTFQQHAYRQPSPELEPFVERYWVVSWDYREPYRQLIVPYPNVHLTFQDGAARVQGVCSGHQVRVLEGRSGVFGVAFRPGCFRPFLRASVSTIRDRQFDAREVFDREFPETPDVASVERFLRAQLPEADATAERAATIVATIAANPAITRVDTLADQLSTSVRALQRLFTEYVGIGPKWVIRRYRLHEVTQRLAEGAPISWADEAARLGYTDQAHFVRDFKTMFGEPPTWYAKRY
jgi:AraC-like DNA-binding protein